MELEADKEEHLGVLEVDRARHVVEELNRDVARLTTEEDVVVRFTVMLQLLDLSLQLFRLKRLQFRSLVPVTLRVIATVMVMSLRHLALLTMVDMADVTGAIGEVTGLTVALFSYII